MSEPSPEPFDPGPTHPLHAHPAFYTLQPHPTNRERQLRTWTDLLRLFLTFQHTHSQPQPQPHTYSLPLPLSDALPALRPLIHNPTINRTLPDTGVLAVLEYALASENAFVHPSPPAKSSPGTASVLTGPNTGKRIYFPPRPLQALADALLIYLESTNERQSILTWPELASLPPMDRLPRPILERVVDRCAKQGKALVIPPFKDDPHSGGIKFI